MDIGLQIFTGNDVLQYINVVSEFRISAFKEYPYLYVGNIDYEMHYMRGYVSNQRAMITIAKFNDSIVGIGTGIPLNSDSEIITDAKDIFQNANIEINDWYYYGELIILPAFRGKGLLTKIFNAQDEILKNWGYKNICFLTIEENDGHPLKPENYETPSKKFKHLGYKKMNLKLNYNWQTIQPDFKTSNQNHVLEFWQKNLTK